MLVNIPEIPDNPSNCLKDNNNAQQVYSDLSEGAYKFKVIATKLANTTDDNNIDMFETQIETVPFNFYIRASGHVGP